jgi:hypothetical protein
LFAAALRAAKATMESVGLAQSGGTNPSFPGRAARRVSPTLKLHVGEENAVHLWFPDVSGALPKRCS